MAIVTMLAAMGTSCQKENMNDPITGVAETRAAYNVQYTINGVAYHAALNDQNEYDALIQRLIGLARMGYEVSFWDADKHNGDCLSKDVVIFRTPDEDEANKWGRMMTDKGYVVTITFDTTTGEFICIAQN